MNRRRFLQMAAAQAALLPLAALFAAPARADEGIRESLDLMEALGDMLDFSRPRDSATIRYRNNQLATNLYRSRTATWYWPNGRVLSNMAGSANATWYWPNGRVMTNLVGSPNATWYWPDGQIMTLRGPGYSEAELLDVPRVATRVLRMAVRNGF